VNAGAVALGLLLLLPAPAFAAPPHTSFGARVQRAGAIFAGTVTDMTWEQLDVVIVTHVSFREARFVKGHAIQGGVARLTQVRGKTSDGWITVPAGLPEFEIGQRYVVLAKEEMGPQGSWIPLAGLRGGLFHVERDGRGREFVSDSSRRPIRGIRGGEIVLATGSSDDERGGSRVSEDEFLSVIRKLLREP
jgi:hypothetical protein